MLRIINIDYKVPFAEVEKHLVAHREYLQIYYDKGNFIASGPKDPRTGGIILAVGDIDTLNEIIKGDPFFANDIADYNIVSFNPVKKSPAFEDLFNKINIINTIAMKYVAPLNFVLRRDSYGTMPTMNFNYFTATALR